MRVVVGKAHLDRGQQVRRDTVQSAWSALVYKDTSLPFGPGLAAGTVVTWLCWRWFGEAVQGLFFHETLLAICVGAGAGFMLLSSTLFGLRRGPREPEPV